MSKLPQPTPEELILAMLRDVLARQAEQMGLTPDKPDELTPSLAAVEEVLSPHQLLPEVVPSIAPPVAEVVPPPRQLLPEIAPTPPALSPEIEQRSKIAAFTSVLRNEPPPAPIEPVPVLPEKVASVPIFAPPPSVEDTQPTARRAPESQVQDEGVQPLSYGEQKLKAEFDELAVRPVSVSALPQIIRVFVITLLALVAGLNVPLVQGTAIIRTLTDPKPVALQDGLLIREEGGPAVYLIQNGRRRLISSSEAFQHYSYRWGEVQEVPRDFLRSIPEGTAIHVLVKCTDLPEIYLLEGQEKRWVREVGALESLGYDVNRDLRWISCARLRNLFDGLPIP